MYCIIKIIAVCSGAKFHLIHQGYSESLANGISMVIKYDRKEMVVLYDFSRRREERGSSEAQKPVSRLISLLFFYFLIFILIRL